jgi:lipid-A-disaccharide synthase-like uncharacterized protein
MELNWWVVFGLAAQGCFFLRFVIQWIASEKKKKSVMPIHFWYLSLVGGIGILIYSIHIGDIVFILGQGAGLLIYARNIILIRRGKNDRKIEA